jgi:1-deoxyxylulose-5-phosphate synthase
MLSGKKGTLRGSTDAAQKRWFGDGSVEDKIIIERVRQLAEKKGVSSSQIALAWLYAKPGVCAPICGMNRIQYLDELVISSRIKLTVEEIAFLEEPYLPKAIIGHS